MSAVPPKIDLEDYVSLTSRHDSRIVSAEDAIALSQQPGNRIIWHPDDQPFCVLIEGTGTELPAPFRKPPPRRDRLSSGTDDRRRGRG